MSPPLSFFTMVIVCNNAARDPHDMWETCFMNPHQEVYALPWVTSSEELSDNLKSNGGRPNRMWQCEKNMAPMDGEFVEMDDKLDGDSFGRMADVVAKGQVAVNDVMTVGGWNPFYGMVLKKTGSSCFVVRGESVDEYFPTEPLSAKAYAATTVPVAFDNNEKFAKASGCVQERVAIMVSSEYLPGMTTFMRFWKLMSGSDMICLIDPKTMKPSKSIPLFRYNRAYMIDAETFAGRFHAG
jgi:hypothetical protein